MLCGARNIGAKYVGAQFVQCGGGSKREGMLPVGSFDRVCGLHN